MPLVFMIDEFVDKETCARLKGGGGSAMWQVLEQDNGPPDAGNQAQLEFATLVAGELFAGQWGPNDGIRFNSASSSDPNNDGSLRVTYPDGLHVDTNNGAIFRCVTCILYLNDLPAECGGATIFPLARAAKAVPQGAHVSTAEAMLREQCTHTRSPVTPTVTGIRVEGGVPKALETQVAQLEELGEPVDESVVRVQPEAGSLCIFFSRLDDGHVDPRSFHGGERIRPPRTAGTGGDGVEGDNGHDDDATQKDIMTLFKEVHYMDGRAAWDVDTSDESFETYLAPQVAEQRRYLEALAEDHARFFD